MYLSDQSVPLLTDVELQHDQSRKNLIAFSMIVWLFDYANVHKIPFPLTGSIYNKCNYLL